MKRLFFYLCMSLAVMTAVIGCQRKASAQVNLAGSVTGSTFDTLTNAGTIYFTTPANSLNSMYEGKYRLHFDVTSLSGTSTFKVVVHSRASGLTGAGYSLHNKVAGTTGIHCDTLQVTAGVPASWDWDLVPYDGTNAGRAHGFKVYFIGTGTQSTRISNVQLLQQK